MCETKSSIPRVVLANVLMDSFKQLYPFSAELISDNTMRVWAYGTKADDGSIMRSKEYLLFGNGLATLAMPQEPNTPPGYVMEFRQQKDGDGVTYWEIQSLPEGQADSTTPWNFNIRTIEPDEDEGLHIIRLVVQDGAPGQCFYLSMMA